MHLNTVSAHSADISARENDRVKLARHVNKFLESNSITVLETRTTPLPGRAVFNHGSSALTDEPKHRALANNQEGAVAEVRRLAALEIEGIKIKRTAFEIGRIMRANGYKLRAKSVERIAKSIGVKLAL